MTAPVPKLPSRTASVAGRQVEYFELGSSAPEDPVVVLLNGAGDTALSWLPVHRRLAAGARVIAYERAGTGCSEDRPGQRLDDLLAELTELLAVVAPGARFVLVGHSFGALLARVYAARNPGRVTGLVLLDGTPDRLGEDRLRRTGYLLYIGATALAARLMTPAVFGALVAAQVLPYYPGRRPFLRQLDPAARRAWKRRVADLFQRQAVAEMRQVLPVAAEARAELAGGTVSAVPATPASPGMPSALPVALVTSGTYGRGWTDLQDAVARTYPGSSHSHTGDRRHHVHLLHVDLVVRVTGQAFRGAARG